MSEQTGQSWKNCDEDIREFISSFVLLIQGFLKDNLVGVYLHGSLTMGSYYRPKSDIDLFIVVHNSLDEPTAKALNILIAKHSEKRPTTSTFELSVITADVAQQPQSPLPFELHYSIGWHDKIMHDAVDYSIKRADVDLIAQLMYVIQRGICLYGEPIPAVFGPVAWPDFIEAALADYKKIIHDEDIVKMPINNILNICRALQLLRQKSTDVHNKDEGAAWGLQHLPVEFKPLIQKALDTYHSSQPVSVADRKTGGIPWDEHELLSLRDYARSTLDSDGMFI